MPPSDPPSDISIRVKVPPGHIEGGNDEFTLGTIPARSKVGEVRLRIQQILPSHPSPERQRLLYAGRALIDNEQALTDALNTRRDVSQTEYVIHLLVKGEQGNGSAAATAGPGHVRAASTPHVARAGTPQGQASTAGEPLPGLVHGMPQNMPPGLAPPIGVSPQQAQIFAQRQAQQAQMRQQMMQQPHRQQAPNAVPGMGFPVYPMPMFPQQMRPTTDQQQQPARNPQQARDSTNHTAGDGTAGQTGPQTATDASPGGNTGGAQQVTGGLPQNRAPDSAPNPAQQPRGAPGRPISGQGFHVQGMGPNGNRFEIHQQTLNFPTAGLPGQQFGFPMGLPQLPGMGLPFPIPGMAQQHHANGMPGAGPQSNTSSALDRARQNVAEMRRMIEEMRGENATAEERARVARLQENIDAVNSYIDPFNVSRANGNPRSNSPMPPQGRVNYMNEYLNNRGMPSQPHQSTMPPQIRPMASQQPSNPSDVTCYLLSSPSGPQALLLSPQHGSYTGTLANNASTGLVPGVSTGFRSPLGTSGQPTPTPTIPADGAAQAPNQPGNAADQVAAPQAQAHAPAQAAVAAEQGGPMQALLNHFWLLFRLLIFAYFLLGANMGWRRPVALLLISLGFWMIRNGLFGDGGVARRWWDGIVRVDQGRGARQGAGDGQAGEQVAEGQMPTPEQVAARILREREEAARRTPLGRAREIVRPVERAGALFFASLWPGVGEAHVRAREAEERRLAEAEIERRRLEEEAKREAEEREREQVEGGEGEKATGAGGDEGAAQAVVQGEKASEGSANTQGVGGGEKSGGIPPVI